jgi:predicted amidohydrolase YtcJ
MGANVKNTLYRKRMLRKKPLLQRLIILLYLLFPNLHPAINYFLPVKMRSNKSFTVALCLVFLLFSSCHIKQRADSIFYNGIVYTVNNNFDIAAAFAVKKGEIIGVGSTQNVLNEFEAKEMVDLKGKPVYPGFIDAHCHFFGYGSDLVKCDLYGTASFDDVINKVTDYAKTNKFAWILGRGWDQNDWTVKEFPSREKLDSLFPNTPVYLMRVDGHAVLCNGEALRRAKITAATKVSGGEVLLKNGQPSGLLIDNAVDIVKGVIPPFTEKEYTDGLLKAQTNCFAVGLTTVDDAGLGRDSINLIAKLQKEGVLKMRVYAMVSDVQKDLDYFFDHGAVKKDRLTVRAVKMYADGALGSRGACLLKPYSDMPGHYGFLLNDVKHFKYVCEQALENGFQVCTHAIGDSAVRTMLQIYSDILSNENERRWRIEHCQVVDTNDLKKFGSHNIIPSVQPTHATSDMYWAEDRLGHERVKTAYAYKDLMDAADNRIAFGTDFPVENINPLYTFYAAVERKDLKGFPEGGFQKENKIKKKDALRAMTIWAAYSNFEEMEKGSIEERKVADFVILDEDIMEIHKDRIPNVKVLATYINGEKVYGE